jgi:hypothetical protein
MDIGCAVDCGLRTDLRSLGPSPEHEAPATESLSLVVTIHNFWVKDALTPDVASLFTSDGIDGEASKSVEFSVRIKALLPRWNKVSRESSVCYAMAVPRATPTGIVRCINEATDNVMRTPQMQARSNAALFLLSDSFRVLRCRWMGAKRRSRTATGYAAVQTRRLVADFTTEAYDRS